MAAPHGRGPRRERLNMPKAAAPRYLGRDFSQASPAMRFGMYFAYWGPNWEKPDGLKKKQWQKILRRGDSDRELMRSLAERHQAAMARVNEQDRFVFDAVATAPFVTGLGSEHPLENGFAFLRDRTSVVEGRTEDK